jgi:hypothetical protein
VSDYTDRFEEKMADYRKENPEVKDTYYIKCYVNGLREEIRHHLKSFEPRTLYQAVEHARNMEKVSMQLLCTADAFSLLLNMLSPVTLLNNSQKTGLLVRIWVPRRNQKNHLFQSPTNQGKLMLASTVASTGFLVIAVSNIND